MKLLPIVSISCLFLISVASTTFLVNDPVLPSTALDYSLSLPTYFTTNAGAGLPSSINGLDNTPSSNPMTNDGATLGRVLFYDTYLSKNGTVACGSCHKAASGFSDPAVLSVGYNGGTTRRHSMTLINARYYQRGRFFWDERAATLEDQVLMPFQDTIEMGLTLTELVQKVNEKSYYAPLFTNAFGTSTVTSDRIAKALAQFVRSIVSYGSKYDIGRAMVAAPGAPFPNFTPSENQGKQLFFQPVANGGGACLGCHTTEAFVSANPGPQNNGIDLVSTTDFGAGETFPNLPLFQGRFKTSSLRNIELTAPYMHDGRFATLEQVVGHYSTGIKNHATLAPALKDAAGNAIIFNFTTTQKNDLVAFMKTLTDNSIATAAKWSNPFPAVVLPIELMSFIAEAQKQQIALQWQTANETNTTDFYLEKLSNGTTWTKIGTVQAKKNTKNNNFYDFLDTHPEQGIQYYRLKQRDADGGVSFSRVASVYYAAQPLSTLSVVQHIANDEISLLFNGFEAVETTDVYVFDLLGKMILTQKGINVHEPPTIDIGSLPQATYLVATLLGNTWISTKLVKR